MEEKILKLLNRINELEIKVSQLENNQRKKSPKYCYDNINDDVMEEILKQVVSIGILIENDTEYIIDKEVVYSIIGEYRISKYMFNKKLANKNFVVKSKNSIYKQVRIGERPGWLYVFNKKLFKEEYNLSEE